MADGKDGIVIRMLQGTQRVALGAVVLALLTATSCERRNAELLYRAYEYASVYPEAFDNYAIENLFSRADEFAGCAAAIRASIAPLMVQARKRCEDLEPEVADSCRTIDEDRILSMLDAMVATARQQTLYAQSPPGQAAVMGKQVLGAGNWEKVQRQVAPVFRPVLLCP